MRISPTVLQSSLSFLSCFFFPVFSVVSSHTVDFFVAIVTSLCFARARKIFSVPVAEFFEPSLGAIFLVAFSFNLVAIVRQDSKAIRPRMEYASQVWSGGPTQSLQRLQDSFCKRHGIRLPPLQTRFDSLSGSALQDEIKSCTAVLMLTSSPASFSNYGIFIPKVRVPSSSHKKIVNIVELCPTVDSPLERTSEGNPRVQDVDQVQNQTKNPFTYLMSTVAFFKTPDDLLCCLFYFFN